MNLQVPHFDARTSEAEYREYDVMDKETGRIVGFIRGRGPGRVISLFDGKYIGTFESHAACWGFAKGVEAVLDHVVYIKEKQPVQNVA